MVFNEEADQETEDFNRRNNRKFAITQAVLMYKGVTATAENVILFARILELYLNEDFPTGKRDEELENSLD